MSIGKFQEKFLGKGCATVVAIGISLVFLFFGFNQCNRYSGMNGTANGQDQQEVIVAKLGDAPVTANQVQDAETRLNSSSNGPLPVAQQARNAAAAVYAAVSQTAYVYLANKNHIAITDDALLAGFQSKLQEEISQDEMALMMQGKVKDPKDMDAAFKQEHRQTPQELLKNNLTGAREALGDKDKRQRLLELVVPQIVQDYYAKKEAPTDQQLRDSYASYITKRIFVVGGDPSKPNGKISQAEAALKSGMSFEDAMNKFSDDPPIGKGKKISDNTNTVPASMLDTSPEYKDLAGKKPGYVSPPETVAGGTAIYKLISIQSNVPKDFQTNLAKYKADFAKQQSDKDVKKDVDAVLAGPDMSWTNQGDKALFDYFKAFVTVAPGSSMLDSMRKAADEGKAASSGSDPGATQAGAYAWYLAFDTVYNDRSSDKAKLRDERIDVLNALLQHTEDFATRLELVDLYTQKKDSNDAITNLIAASHANTDYSGIGTRQFGDIMAKRAALVKAGLAKDAELKELDQAQDEWRKEKANSDKEDAEAKRQEAIAKAQEAENEKKNAEEVAKQKAEADKNAPKTANPAPPHAGPATSSPPGLLPPGTVGPSKSGSGSLLPPGSVPSRGAGG